MVIGISGTERGAHALQEGAEADMPQVREGILAPGDAPRRGNTSTPCTNPGPGGQRTRSFCYLGPKDGYAAGLVAHSWRGAPWLALSAMGATLEEFRRPKHLGEVGR